jgi:hypothetical protein
MIKFRDEARGTARTAAIASREHARHALRAQILAHHLLATE